MILQEKPREKIFILSQKTKFCGEKRHKGSIFPYHPAIGYKWNTNLSVQWSFKREQ